MSRTVHTLCSAALVLAAAACAGSDDAALQDTTGAAAATPAPVSAGMTDAEIVGALTAANAAEISLSEVALDSTSNSEVKAFAQVMMTDHKAMNEQVHALGQQLNITSTAGPRTDDLAESTADAVEELRGTEGAEFDRAYMDAMVSSHEKALATIDRALEATNTAQLDQQLTEARTKVQQHLDRAKQVQQALPR